MSLEAPTPPLTPRRLMRMFFRMLPSSAASLRHRRNPAGNDIGTCDGDDDEEETHTREEAEESEGESDNMASEDEGGQGASSSSSSSWWSMLRILLLLPGPLSAGVRHLLVWRSSLER